MARMAFSNRTWRARIDMSREKISPMSMATGMFLAVPPIIFTFVASRQIITGMTAGAVKG